MKKLLFVIPYLVEGGAERALSNITIHFPADWDIDILVNDDTIVDYLFKGNIITLGIRGEAKTDSVVFQFRAFLKRVNKLRSLKNTENYVACISFLDSANVANILTGNRHCKTIISVRTSLKQSAKRPQYKYIVNPLAKMLYNMADKVVAVSEGVREELITAFKLKNQNIITIENGYNLADLQSQAQKELVYKDKVNLDSKRIIVTTGRLSEEKGQWHLIRAFTEVIRKIPDALLVIIGSGEMEGYLKLLARLCGIERNIYFTGHVSNPYQYLYKAEFFVLPSMREGFPNALAEAICVGLPCISTDFRAGARELLAPAMDVQGSGVDRIVETEYGILTPLCSGRQYQDLQEPLEWAEQCLAEAMIKLLTDDDKRNEYREKSKIRRETLRIEAMINRWIEVIESC